MLWPCVHVGRPVPLLLPALRSPGSPALPRPPHPARGSQGRAGNSTASTSTTKTKANWSRRKRPNEWSTRAAGGATLPSPSPHQEGSEGAAAGRGRPHQVARSKEQAAGREQQGGTSIAAGYFSSAAAAATVPERMWGSSATRGLQQLQQLQ